MNQKEVIIQNVDKVDQNNEVRDSNCKQVNDQDGIVFNETE